jgi:hypothetical protein
MKLSDLPTVNGLAQQLQSIKDKLSSVATVQILVKGVPIEPALLAQLHAVGDPVVLAYFQSAQAAIVASLATYSVSAT